VPESGLQRVDGRLVSDVIPLAAAASPLVQRGGERRGTAERERAHVGSGSVPAAIAASLAVLALLGLGAARELGLRWRALVPGAG
jgi:hypothetical protein